MEQIATVKKIKDLLIVEQRHYLKSHVEAIGLQIKLSEAQNKLLNHQPSAIESLSQRSGLDVEWEDQE
jgi:hypothetical protein